MNATALALAGDAPALAAIHAAAFPPGLAWSEADIAELLSMPGCFALRQGGDAFIMCRVAADEAEVLTVATRPDARRRGLARGLLDAAFAACRARAADVLFLEVGAVNPVAQSLYTGLGFTEIARRPRYYPDGTDAIVMRLRLS